MQSPETKMGTLDSESGGGGGEVCFSDDDVGSCISRLFSMQDGTEGDRSSGGESAAVDCSILIGDDETKRECRICHLTMEFGIAIELGCSCKDDLGAAHKHCAETWFKIRGNRTCEICNAVALNVLENEAAIAISINQGISASQDLQRSCSNGHRLVNFILSCMIFAFSLSWLFHFNVDS